MWTERTVYIENFSVEDDHDSLRKRLSKFGKVCGGCSHESPIQHHVLSNCMFVFMQVNLVSMPRFPQSKRFKGFAFVEFASTQAALAAVAAALAMDPELLGIRAISKVKWQELKEKMKEQLATAAPHEAEADERAAASDVSRASLEQEGEPKTDRKRAQKKRKNGHIHFAADDEDEPAQQQAEMQAVTKKMKVL